MVGRGHVDRVDVVARQQLAEVVVGLAVVVVVVLVDAVLGRCRGATAARRRRPRTARRRGSGRCPGRRSPCCRCRCRPSRSARWPRCGRRRRQPRRARSRARHETVASVLTKSRRGILLFLLIAVSPIAGNYCSMLVLSAVGKFSGNGVTHLPVAPPFARTSEDRLEARHCSGQAGPPPWYTWPMHVDHHLALAIGDPPHDRLVLAGAAAGRI